ncbi:unnamed protein product [Allacma fusca]|uniref:Uncharacterized protein n=1 Tax=Allacma fusca TaxID=39272 RepID=A0A8J2LUU8_9HEXA|nr:unnamed protein product [Allacma fusca]
MDNMTRGKVGIAFLDRRAVLLSAFGLVGFGALVGVGSVYILYMKKRLKEHFLIQSTLQSQINELRNDIESLRVKLGIEDTPVVKPALKRRKKNSVRVTFLEGTKSDVEDDEYVTASSSSNSEYDEDAVVVFRNRKKFGTDLEANTTEAGDHAREGENSEIQEFVSKIDKLFEGSMSDHHEAYVTLKTNQDSLANSYAFWWRFAKATHLEAGLAAQQKDKELQKSLLENGRYPHKDGASIDFYKLLLACSETKVLFMRLL